MIRVFSLLLSVALAAHFICQASRRPIDDELSMDVFLDRFARLVGTDRRKLRAPAPAAFDEMMRDA